ncbi:hypothetical protein ACFFRR_007513 [Megaselia abdita]
MKIIILLLITIQLAFARNAPVNLSDLRGVLGTSFAAVTSSPTAEKNYAECFNFYMPYLDTIASESESATKTCQSAADASLKQAQEDASATLTKINEEFTNFENLFTPCSSSEVAVNGLNCYVTEGNENVVTFSNIISDAKTGVRVYNQAVNNINNINENCNSEVSDQSQVASEVVYSKLMDCLSTGQTEDFQLPPIGSDSTQATVEVTTTTLEPTTQEATTSTTDNLFGGLTLPNLGGLF